jgi:hypothetical protein
MTAVKAQGQKKTLPKKIAPQVAARLLQLPNALDKAIADAVAEHSSIISETCVARAALGDDALLSRSEAARALGLSPRTLEAWARIGTGPRCLSQGKRATAYRVADLKDYVSRLSPSAE